MFKTFYVESILSLLDGKLTRTKLKRTLRVEKEKKTPGLPRVEEGRQEILVQPTLFDAVRMTYKQRNTYDWKCNPIRKEDKSGPAFA